MKRKRSNFRSYLGSNRIAALSQFRSAVSENTRRFHNRIKQEAALREWTEPVYARINELFSERHFPPTVTENVWAAFVHRKKQKNKLFMAKLTKLFSCILKHLQVSTPARCARRSKPTERLAGDSGTKRDFLTLDLPGFALLPPGHAASTPPVGLAHGAAGKPSAAPPGLLRLSAAPRSQLRRGAPSPTGSRRNPHDPPALLPLRLTGH